MGAGIVRISTDSSLDDDLATSGRLVLVAFGRSDCGPCRLLAPGLRALAASESERLLVTKLDAASQPKAADRFSVDSYPTCILFRDGRPIERLEGYMPLRKLQAIIEPHFGR